MVRVGRHGLALTADQPCDALSQKAHSGCLPARNYSSCVPLQRGLVSFVYREAMSLKYPVFPVMFTVTLLCLSATMRAQQPEEQLVYKFAVQGIAEPVAAKALQAALVNEPTVLFCSFIDEADVFKLAANVVLDHTTLKALLHTHGYMLEGNVYVSNGLILSPQQPSTQTE